MPSFSITFVLLLLVCVASYGFRCGLTGLVYEYTLVCGEVSSLGSGNYGRLFFEFRPGDRRADLENWAIQAFESLGSLSGYEFSFVTKWKYYYYDKIYSSYTSLAALVVWNRNFTVKYSEIISLESLPYCDPVAVQEELSCLKVLGYTASEGMTTTTAKLAYSTYKDNRDPSVITDQQMDGSLVATITVIVVLSLALIISIGVITTKVKTNRWCVISHPREIPSRNHQANMSDEVYSTIPPPSHVQLHTNNDQQQGCRREVSFMIPRNTSVGSVTASTLTYSQNALPTAPPSEPHSYSSPVLEGTVTHTYLHPRTTEMPETYTDYSNYYSISQ